MKFLRAAAGIRRAPRDSRAGQSATEYILLVAFLALVGVGVASMLGTGIRGLLGSVTAHLQAALGTPPPPPSSPAG